MATAYSVRVYRNRIPPIFRAGGEGNRWMYRVSVAMMRESIARAPARTGQLKSRHRISPARSANQYAATFQITNDSDHAGYVHDGTTGPILPSNATRLVLPAGGGYPKIFAKSVSGQRANPWLDNACTTVAIRYGAARVA